MTGTLDLLDDEAPTGRALEREVHLIDAAESRKPFPERLAIRRADPPARNHAATDVNRQVGDLATMNIKRAYDPHRDLLELHGLERPACSNTLVPRGVGCVNSVRGP
jgi:hypothetical protein